MATATANVAMKSWDEAPFHEIEGGPNLVRANVAFTYSGDLEGEGTLIYLMTYLEGGVPTMGLERVVGRIGDKEGSFVLRHEGAYQDNAARDTFTVIPGSGTGALQGLRGEGKFEWPEKAPSGTLTLEYEFGD